MDFLTKAYNQVLDLFRTMTVGMRVTAGLLLVVIVISLVYLFVFQVHSGTDYLFGAREFSQGELDAMQAAFAAAELDQFEVVGYRIRVPRHKRYQYLQALSQNNFTPENFDSAIDEVLSSSSSWFESKQLRQLRVSHATQKKLSLVLSAMTGIEKATVQYHEERKGGYPPVVVRKVTIAVAAAGRRPLDLALVRAVRTTASGWFGIDSENVVVTDLINGRAYSGKSDINEFGSANTLVADTKRMFEKQWEDKIYHRLSMYPGIVAVVNVELDTQLDQKTQKVSYDPQPTAVEQSSSSKTMETKPPVGGRPGAVPNQVPSNTPREILSVNDLQTSSEESQESQVAVAGYEQTVSQRAGLIPKQVNVSIGVPKSYFAKVWLQRNPPKEGEQPGKPAAADLQGIEQEISQTIETALVNLVPKPADGTNPFPQVKVSSYDDMPAEAIIEPSVAETGIAWLSDNWQTLALFGIGLMSLLMVRSMIRSGTADAPEIGSQVLSHVSATDESGEPEFAEESVPGLPRRGKSTGPNLREELTVLVKEDPDAAANVLRTWIGDIA